MEKNNEIILKEFDTITLNIISKKENDKQLNETKKVILGFHEIDSFIEKYLLETKNFILHKQYKLQHPDLKTKYIIEIIGVFAPGKTRQEERKIIQTLKQKVNEQNLQIAEYITKIFSYEQELNQKQEEFKKIAADLQQKAQTEINKFRQQNSEQTKKEIEDIKKYALQDFFEDFLLSLNNLEIAIHTGLKSQNPEVSAYTKGFLMLLNKIQNTLEDYGITKIVAEVGDMFDANIHQIFDFDDQGVEKEMILKLKSPGYKLHDRVLKPALVIVQK
ncbi:nucleotide exchange factor GrpE [Mycoplasma miroungirhinis]|uniref:Protein GrpE n=1 Tax=Mycoplasma miroungirhinis TaxID=754516 RepID=A0A6M4JD02_9MOLU|nr:nucleotide exchange factor GrpE [Mycoplasma miroungirhinis]QJR43916.1 nucleotide exchange factor GrpE [Mycoplasma miroungirhinis]